MVTSTDGLGRRFRVERWVSCEHDVYKNAQAPHVAAFVVSVRPGFHGLGFVVSDVLLGLQHLERGCWMLGNGCMYNTVLYIYTWVFIDLGLVFDERNA